MYVILIARHKHHRKYFSYLADHAGVSMKVYSLDNLPWIRPSAWMLSHRVSINGLTAHHLRNRKNREKLWAHTAGSRRRSRLYWSLYGKAIAFRTFLSYIRLRQVFMRERPDAIVVWNGGNWLFKAAIKAAEELGIRVFFAENGPLPNTTTFDPKGINYENSLPREAAFYRGLTSYRDNFSPVLVPRVSSKSLAAREILLPKRYLFVPFQVNTDSQILLNSPWIRDMYHLLEILRRIVGRLHDPGIVFVVKEHPSCHSSYENYYEKVGDRIVFANGNKTQDLIQGAEAVITVNSTVGIEALLLNRKVIVLGKAFYAIEDMVLMADDEESLIQAIDQSPVWQPDELLRLKFLTYLSDIYCIPGSWKTPDAMHCQKIRERLHRVLLEGQPL